MLRGDGHAYDDNVLWLQTFQKFALYETHLQSQKYQLKTQS